MYIEDWTQNYVPEKTSYRLNHKHALCHIIHYKLHQKS